MLGNKIEDKEAVNNAVHYTNLRSPDPNSRRRSSRKTAHLVETSAKLHIDLDDRKRSGFSQARWSAGFKSSLELSIRVAFGVLLASCLQTRDPKYDPTENAEYSKKWIFFPDWYYLGGLSYCAVAVIFSAGRNVGTTLKEVWQAFCGVGIALIYNIILFSTFSNASSDNWIEKRSFVNVTKSISLTSYVVDNDTFYKLLPWMMAFTIVILILPMENNTKKFAVANNLYFTLTIINPNHPLDSSKLKLDDLSYFNTSNILRNLVLYFLVGFMGSCLSILIMFVPYPIFAVRKLRSQTTVVAEDVLELLNLIVDSYCIKHKNNEHMGFLQAKLARKFDAVAAHHRQMLILLEDVWWEQLLGFNIILGFNLSVLKKYVGLIGSLISDLQSLSNAMQLEKYEAVHFKFMKSMQREIYIIQIRSTDLLREISQEIHSSARYLDLKSIKKLEDQMEAFLIGYRWTQNRIFRDCRAPYKEVEGNVPFNLFLFSLNSFCTTLVNFQKIFNETNHSALVRGPKFIRKSFFSFFERKRYKRTVFLSAFKVSSAILMGTFLAVYVCAYSNTTPAAVAYVMGNHVGGSFSVTVNRVGGVVAGSVLPSIFSIFINQICYPYWLSTVLNNAVLFLWVAISMYVRFSGGYANYAGIVSAFIAAGILLKQYNTCQHGGISPSTIALSSYSSVAQTSIGIFLFILVEFALCPKSATKLLRQNIHCTLSQLQVTFKDLLGHHLYNADVMDQSRIERLQVQLQNKIPALLLEQKRLLAEAKTEPQLWRPSFSGTKYELIHESLHGILINNNLLLRLIQWYHYRTHHRDTPLANCITTEQDKGNASCGGQGASCTEKWRESSTQFQNYVCDAFQTLQMLFGNEFMYSEPDQTAIFLQMKEAFRLADKDCSGEIDADEVAILLESIFVHSGAVGHADISKYVEKFMSIVDTDQSGKVSFEEFMNALENGLKLQVEVYTQCKPRYQTIHDINARTNSKSNSYNRSFLRKRSERGSEYNFISGPAVNPLETFVECEEAELPTDSSRQSAALIDRISNITIATNYLVTETGNIVQEELAVKTKEALISSSSSIHQCPIPSSDFHREHDILNIEEYSLIGFAAEMKSEFVQWIMEDERYKTIALEELLLLSCLVSGAEQIARTLNIMGEIVVSS